MEKKRKWERPGDVPGHYRHYSWKDVTTPSSKRRPFLKCHGESLLIVRISDKLWHPQKSSLHIWCISFLPKCKRIRDKSKKTRFEFTDMLKAHGCNKPGHYIQITKSMKHNLGIEDAKKKAEYDKAELLKTSAAEMVAAANILQEHPHDYHECKEITDEASAAIETATRPRLAS